MILTFRPIKVFPPEWRSAWVNRPRSPFEAGYHRTLEDLDREIRYLEGRDPFLQLDVDDPDLRLDGQLRAGARVKHPGVLLTFDSKKHGSMVYGTDRFDHWHANLRAIALGLQCLKRVETYGIAERGQQYAGYRELGPGTIELGSAMTVEEAARILHAAAEPDSLEVPADALVGSPELVKHAYRTAATKHHPDAGGDPEVFRRLTEARDLLLERTPA